MTPEIKSWSRTLFIINSFHPELKAVSLLSWGFLLVVWNISFYSDVLTSGLLTLGKLCFSRNWLANSWSEQLLCEPAFHMKTDQFKAHPVSFTPTPTSPLSDSYTSSQYSPASVTPCSDTRQLKTVPTPQSLLKLFKLTNSNLFTLPHLFFPM